MHSSFSHSPGQVDTSLRGEVMVPEPACNKQLLYCLTMWMICYIICTLIVIIIKGTIYIMLLNADINIMLSVYGYVSEMYVCIYLQWLQDSVSQTVLR